MSSPDRMDHDANSYFNTPDRSLDGTPERRRGGVFGVLKRMRSAMNVKPPNKAVRHSSSETAGQPSSRQLESPASHVTAWSIRTRTPDTLPPLPEDRPPLPEDRPILPEYRPLTENATAGKRSPLPHERHPFLEPNLSEDDLLEEPVRHRPVSPGTSTLSTVAPSNPDELALIDPREYRSIKLFENYGIELGPGLWAPKNRPAAIERVRKESRQRRHHHCCKDGLDMGPTKVCICGHRKCRNCTEFPGRKEKGSGSSSRRDGEMSERSPLLPRESSSRLGMFRGTPSRRTPSRTTPDPEKPRSHGHTPDHTHDHSHDHPHDGSHQRSHERPRPPYQTHHDHDNVPPHNGSRAWPPRSHQSPNSPRVTLSFTSLRPKAPIVQIHRVCHFCYNPFIFSERVCMVCDHRQCSRCSYTQPRQSTQPTEPQVRLRTKKKPRFRIKITCDQCSNLFVELEKVCGSCGHRLCENCHQERPRKSRAEVADTDPAVFNSLENRLATIAIDEASTPTRPLPILTMPSSVPHGPQPDAIETTLPDLPELPDFPDFHLEDHEPQHTHQHAYQPEFEPGFEPEFHAM